MHCASYLHFSIRACTILCIVPYALSESMSDLHAPPSSPARGQSRDLSNEAPAEIGLLYQDDALGAMPKYQPLLGRFGLHYIKKPKRNASSFVPGHLLGALDKSCAMQ